VHLLLLGLALLAIARPLRLFSHGAGAGQQACGQEHQGAAHVEFCDFHG
jgi:hypothetical protein